MTNANQTESIHLNVTGSNTKNQRCKQNIHGIRHNSNHPEHKARTQKTEDTWIFGGKYYISHWSQYMPSIILFFMKGGSPYFRVLKNK
jgi:hypothetical protein